MDIFCSSYRKIGICIFWTDLVSFSQTFKPNKLSRKYGNWYTFLKNEHFFVYTKFASYGKYIAKITVPKKCYCWRDKKLQAAMPLSEEEALARFLKHCIYALL